MDKIERYREIFMTFKQLCAQGKQPSSFSAYCVFDGVDQNSVR